MLSTKKTANWIHVEVAAEKVAVALKLDGSTRAMLIQKNQDIWKTFEDYFDRKENPKHRRTYPRVQPNVLALYFVRCSLIFLKIGYSDKLPVFHSLLRKDNKYLKKKLIDILGPLNSFAQSPTDRIKLYAKLVCRPKNIDPAPLIDELRRRRYVSMHL